MHKHNKNQIHLLENLCSHRIFYSVFLKTPVLQAQWHQLKDLNIQKVDAFFSFVE